MAPFRPRLPAVRPRRGVIGLAGARAVAGIGAVALAGGGIAAGRAGRPEPVVDTGAVRVAGVLVGALRPRIPAVRPRRGVIGLADTRAAAGVRRVALAGRRIAAGRARRLAP